MTRPVRVTGCLTSEDRTPSESRRGDCDVGLMEIAVVSVAAWHHQLLICRRGVSPTRWPVDSGTLDTRAGLYAARRDLFAAARPAPADRGAVPAGTPPRFILIHTASPAPIP